jgi:hypothetical protein
MALNCRRLKRRTCAFRGVALFAMYKFVRIHKTLRTTPAIVVGVSKLMTL